MSYSTVILILEKAKYLQKYKVLQNSIKKVIESY